MIPSRFGSSPRLVLVAPVFLALLACAPRLLAEPVYVRVNQVGYEAGHAPFRAYLMAPSAVTGATFQVANSKGVTADSGRIGTGALLGAWGHSKTVTYNVYALDFNVPGGDLYTIKVSGQVSATSPAFAVDSPETLYSGLLLNTLFFYETQRDGKHFIPNALRTASGHLKDANAHVYNTPPLDGNDFIDNVPPTPPLVSAGLPNIDAAGGWWDAGDYEKYVETVSYTAALMEIGIRDFPEEMGAAAPWNPPAPPASISYAGNSGAGAPASSDFTDEARFGVDWLMKMWDDKTKTLYYQVDNTQDWDYYGEGDPTSAVPNCGGTYAIPYCLITEYDIWTLPQAADHFFQPGDPRACDPLTTYYICNRPLYLAGPAGSPISPNLAGRLAADFALCYQLQRASHPALANQCLQDAEDVFALADTSYPDPAPAEYGGTCSDCLLTIAPFDGYPENVWDDDMELGATELYFALQSAGGAKNLPAGLPHTNAMDYLAQAATFAHNYITRIYDNGFTDTLNLYDVSGLAHFELYRALDMAGNPQHLAVSRSGIRAQLLRQVADAITQANSDAWGFGYVWSYGDTTSHGAGLSVMASEAAYLSNTDAAAKRYGTYAQRWLGNVLGANAWGSSFIVGDGSTFPNCIQHQVANLAGALDGTSGGTPVLWGAATEGPAGYASSGVVDGMILCPANGVDTFRKFNGNDGAFDRSQMAVYQDNMQSYSTTEPAIDLTATSFLMWSWRLAGQPSF
ncbi:MAG TPA: glycoside hydrolase family 9 protein [Terriglobales bacterium]|nr:glycoside hydrolase family 9 protein [Terriglobales bacterium]